MSQIIKPPYGGVAKVYVRAPNKRFSVKSYDTYELLPGTMLVRVFNSVDARTARPPRTALTFNDQVRPVGSLVGGRFDGTDLDPYFWLYGSDPTDTPDVALWEALFFHARADRRRGMTVLSRAEVEQRSLQWFTPTKPLKVVDIRDIESLSKFGAPIQILQTPKYSRTRDWASFIRRNTAPDVCGMVYASRQSMLNRRGWNLVFVHDRMAKNALKRWGPEMPLTSGVGSRMLGALAARYQIVIEP